MGTEELRPIKGPSSFSSIGAFTDRARYSNPLISTIDLRQLHEMFNDEKNTKMKTNVIETWPCGIAHEMKSMYRKETIRK